MNRPTSNGVPLVSFGLPVRNGAPTIAQAIESVLAQTFEDWELVISDNLSSDGTSEICASFAARDERIRHIPSGRDLSIHENFRAAFHHSRGTYFRWHGDDDWLEPEYAERVVATLDRVTGIRPLHDGSAVLPRRAAATVNDPVPMLGGVDSTDAATRVRALLHLFQNGGRLGIDPVYSLVRRDVAAQTGLQGSIRDGDFVYSCEMALLGPFVHVPEVLAHRRLLPASRMGISRNLLQREQSILYVARASRGLTTRSRVSLCAALVAFATREHAHGVRRRARAVRDRYRTVAVGEIGTSRPRHGRRCRRECLLNDAKHLRALPLLDRREPAELEAAELDTTLRAHGGEPELVEEVAGKHRSMDEEALLHRLAFRVAVRERLERLRAAVARLADRREEERLLDPLRTVAHEVRARDEHRVVRGRPGGEVGRAREEMRRAVLQRAEQASSLVEVDRPPLAPVLLGALRSSAPWTPSRFPRDCHHTHSGTPTAPSGASRGSDR